MNKTLQTYKKIYREYAEKNKMNLDVQNSLDEFIALLLGKKVLDVGCAHGRESAYLAKQGFDVTGIDITPEFIAMAKNNCPDCKFEVMDMTNLSFADASFDGIWASASFLHIPKNKAQQTLSGFFSVLKPGGIIFLSVMEGTFTGYRKNKDLNWEERFFSDYTVPEFQQSLENAGFEIITHRTNTTPWGRTFIHIFARKAGSNVYPGK